MLVVIGQTSDGFSDKLVGPDFQHDIAPLYPMPRQTSPPDRFFSPGEAAGGVRCNLSPWADICT